MFYISISAGLTGKFINDKYKGNLRSIDMNKAYTKRILEMKYLPIGDEFCYFKKYENEPIFSISVPPLELRKLFRDPNPAYCILAMYPEK